MNKQLLKLNFNQNTIIQVITTKKLLQITP